MENSLTNSFTKIVSIHGAPRSGTSWLGQIFDSSPEVRYKFQPLFSYSFKDRINIASNRKEILQFFEDLYNYPKDNFLDQLERKRKNQYPIFKVKKERPKYLVTKMIRYHFLVPNLLDFLDNIFIVAIIRNPCAAINSWRKAPREFLSQWNFESEWYFGQSMNNFRPEQYYGFNRWKESSKLFIEMERKYPSLCKSIKYEKLVSDPYYITRKLFNFVGLDLTESTNQFIKASTSLAQDDPYSVYKGKKEINEWKSELNEKIIKKVYEELEGTEFEKYLI